MKSNRYILIVLAVVMIGIALLTGCSEPQSAGPCATPIPVAMTEPPIRYDEKEEIPMHPEFAKMRIPTNNEAGLWGYRDVMGNWIIEPKYTKACGFREGLAPVAIVRDGQEYWGYVNEIGREVIELKYSYVRDFSNGLAFVREKNIEGKGVVSNNYIDKDGIDILDFDTDITEGFWFDDEGMAVVYKRDGEEVIHGVIDRDGNFLIPFDKGFQSIAEMPEKFFAAIPVEPIDGNQKTGVIDHYGEWILKPKYDSVEVLGRDRVLVGTEDEKGIKSEIISFDGETIINLGYGYADTADYPYMTKYNMFIFCKSGAGMPQNELYDINGDQLLDNKTYEMIRILSEDVIYVADQDGSYLVSKAGDKIVDVDVPYAPRRISEDIIKIPTNSKGGLYNFKQDIWVANPIYENILYYNGTQGEAIRDVKKADGNVTIVIDTFDNKGEVLTTRGETMTEGEYDKMVRNIVDITLRYEGLV